MSDRIVVEGLKVFGRHGVEPREREHGQDFLIDLTLRLDLKEAAQSDDLATTVDYAQLVAQVRTAVETETYFLIEALAERICRIALAHPRVASVTAAVWKPEVAVQLGVDRVGVRMRRSSK